MHYPENTASNLNHICVPRNLRLWVPERFTHSPLGGHEILIPLIRITPRATSEWSYFYAACQYISASISISLRSFIIVYTRRVLPLWIAPNHAAISTRSIRFVQRTHPMIYNIMRTTRRREWSIVYCYTPMQGYRVYHSAGTSPLVVLGDQELRVVVSDLKQLQNHTHFFQVAAFTGVGDGPLSDTVSINLRPGGWYTRRTFRSTEKTPYRLDLRDRDTYTRVCVSE